MSELGVHFIPTHTGSHHYQFIKDMRPGIVKLVGSSTPDVQQISDCFLAAPFALMYLRNVARSEQHDFLWSDPKGAAQQHAREWHDDIQRIIKQAAERGLKIPSIGQIRILGINEPIIELFPRNEDMSNYDEWIAMMNDRTPKLDEYMVTFGTEGNRYGYGTGLGNLSSGQPANKKPGEYATFDWFPRTRKFLESTRALNAYTCHEYWRAETGPEGHADWHSWRFTHLEGSFDIHVLESGVDQAITSEPYNGNRGWVGHMDAAAYVDQHRRYIARANQDLRFLGETPFTLDGDKMWESFWIEYCMPEMVSLADELSSSSSPPNPFPEPPKPPRPEPPLPEPSGKIRHPLPGSVITQHMYQNPKSYERFGLVGHNGTDLVDLAPPSEVLSIADGTVQFVENDRDYGWYCRIYHPQFSIHSFYAHLRELPMVSPWQKVTAGQPIGYMGSSGNSTGPHLHLEIRRANPDGSYGQGVMGKGRIDPESWFAINGIRL